MKPQECFFEVLRRKLSFSECLSFEWSFKIFKSGIQERDKIICWVHHDRGKADKEIDICRELLGDFAVLSEVPSSRILNLGVGICADRRSLYVHYVQDDGAERYQAFDGNKKFEYRFFYFPCTPQLEPPEKFVRSDMRALFRELSSDARLQAMSGFWLRSRGDDVDQVCLSYTHRPRLKEFLPALRTFTLADLSGHQEQRIKHLAFHADGSLTVYLSARLPQFPVNVSVMKRNIAAEAETTHRQIEHRLRGVSFLPRPHNDALDQFYSPSDLAAWQKLLGKDMFYHFGLFDECDDPDDLWNDRPFLRATENICQHIRSSERVYDLGCGYGGVARYLRDVKGCSVLAATISRAQFQYCHGIGVPCRYTDMEASAPPGLFDSILMCESLEHVHNKFALLKKLKHFAKKLVIRTNTQEAHGQNVVFGGSMRTVSSRCLQEMLQECGYRIVYWEDKRSLALPTIKVWKARLAAVPIENDAHYEAWKEFTHRVSGQLEAWSRQHKLLDIVAICA
jgi:cyclopropane fatty-acyl-phospholipid synthase-like methyltransferase